MMPFADNGGRERRSQGRTLCRPWGGSTMRRCSRLRGLERCFQKGFRHSLCRTGGCEDTVNGDVPRRAAALGAAPPCGGARGRV